MADSDRVLIDTIKEAAMSIDESMMARALDLARTAEAHGDVPVAAIVAKDGEVVGQSEPRTMVDGDPTAHAEVLALRNAAATLGTPYLAGCTMYGTYEPCPMCCGAIMNSGIETLVLGGRFEGEHRTYGNYSVSRMLEMAGASERIELVEGVMRGECETLFTPEKRDEWLDRMRGENPGWGNQ